MKSIVYFSCGVEKRCNGMRCAMLRRTVIFLYRALFVLVMLEYVSSVPRVGLLPGRTVIVI